MYLSATFLIAALSFFVEAMPTSRSGVAIPIKKRTQVRNANGVVDVTMLLHNVRYTTAQIHRGFRVYEENTGVRHPYASKVKRSDSSNGSEPLVHHGHYYWYGPLSVGTPAKTFMVDFDTGSCDLILSNSDCGAPCAGRALYSNSDSCTAVDLKKPFDAAYGSNPDPISGMLYEDNVTVAGFTVKKQTLGSAHHFPDSLNSTNFLPDGILGLAFQSLSAFKVPSFLHNLAKQHSLPTNSFGFYIADDGSELFLGGTNDQLHKGDFLYVPLTHEGYWQTRFNAIYLHGRKFGGNRDAIIHTGSSLVLGDSKTVQALYKQIRGSTDLGGGIYSVPCTFNTTISIQFGGSKLAIYPQVFLMGSLPESPKNCVGGIAASDSFPFWVLGEVFLQNVYSQFDFGNKRVGFATLQESLLCSLC